jgi:hypothetical protein
MNAMNPKESTSRYSYVLMILVILSAIFPRIAWCQTPTWTEYPNNPVLGQGHGDPFRTYYPSVIYDENYFSGHGMAALFKMWYNTSSDIALAVSDDGLNWTNIGSVSNLTNGSHPLVEYYPAGFIGGGGSTMYYRIWYWDTTELYDVAAIRYAESVDGSAWENDQPIQNSPDPNTVPIITGISPNWNRGSYGPCDVLYNPAASNAGTDWVFTMYYDGTTGGEESIGIAFSDDGITWIGYDPDSNGLANPVMTGTYQAGDWDYDFTSRATILKHSPTHYEMWYSGGTGAMNHGIGYAFSSDGLNWVRYLDNPILYRDDVGYPGVAGWRSNRTYCPAVLVLNGGYRMWFAGRSPSGEYSIGTTEALFAAIPTLNQWGMIIMSLLLLIAGTLILRRRHAVLPQRKTP